ncbi:MAG: HAMP domain-containing sensor histidine kinase [Limnothrix sp.]
MISADPLPNEEARLAALFRQEILDSPEEEDLNNLVKLAANLCDTDISLISLVDNHRQWFKASYGLDAKETPKKVAFCAHAIHGSGLFEIPNALQDERFADNPLVIGEPHIRSYAGQPLRSPDGYNLGTLCVINRKPTVLSLQQRETLALLARQVEKYLELRYQVHKTQQSVKVIEAQAESLQQANKVKDQLLTVLAHDLRSPVATLEGIVDAFDHDCLTADDVVELVGELRPQVKQTVTQLSQVLSWAHQQMNHETINLEAFSVEAIACYSLSWVEDRAATKQVKLKMDLGNNFWACGDISLVDIVLRNLLANAIKYSRHGDTVTLFARRNDGKIRIGIQDVGLGMELSTLEKLRTATYQMSMLGTDNEVGTGLGLLLCQTYLRKMDTELNIQSIWKEGSTFSFELVSTDNPNADEVRPSLHLNNANF